MAAFGLTALFAIGSMGGVAAAHGQKAKIVAPKAVRMPQNAGFAVRVSTPAKRIAFFVDSRRRWVARSDSRRFSRRGHLRTARMAPGRHRLRIRAKLSTGRVVSARRVLYLAKEKSSHERSHKSTESSTETTSAETTSASSELLFNGSHISDFALLQEAPGAISEVPDPLGSSETDFKFTVNDQDVYPVTPTENPRAQALSPNFIEPGNEIWLKTKFMFPSNFPLVPEWLGLVSIYGQPFNGPSPWSIAIDSNELRWQRNGTYNWDIPWRAPLVRDRWYTVLLHERFGADGWVEMWIDGNRVTFFPSGNYNPGHYPETEHLAMATMDSSNNGGPNHGKIMQYRKVGMFETATVYFGSLKLGMSRSSVGG